MTLQGDKIMVVGKICVLCKISMFLYIVLFLFDFVVFRFEISFFFSLFTGTDKIKYFNYYLLLEIISDDFDFIHFLIFFFKCARKFLYFVFIQYIICIVCQETTVENIRDPSLL